MDIELMIIGAHVPMGTDALISLGFKVKQGNNVYINLEPDTREETKRLLDSLSEVGVVTKELQNLFWCVY